MFILVKIRQGVVIIRTLPIICGAHQFHSFRTLPIICGAHQFHSFLPAVSVSKGKYPGWSLIALRNLKMVYFHVYRLEEDGSVLKEGGVTLSLLVLRACSYKSKAEAWQQGFAPYSSRGRCRFLLIVMTQMNTDSCPTLLSASSAETN